MAIHEDGVVGADVGPDGVGKGAGAGGLVVDGRDGAEGQDDLGQHAAGHADPGDGEGDRDRGVGVDDGAAVRALVVAGEVHPDLRGGAALPPELAALTVNDDQILIGEEALVAARFCTEDAAITEQHREVPVHGDKEVPGIELVADADHLGAEAGLWDHGDC